MIFPAARDCQNTTFHLQLYYDTQSGKSIALALRILFGLIYSIFAHIHPDVCECGWKVTAVVRFASQSIFFSRLPQNMKTFLVSYAMWFCAFVTMLPLSRFFLVFSFFFKWTRVVGSKFLVQFLHWFKIPFDKGKWLKVVFCWMSLNRRCLFECNLFAKWEYCSRCTNSRLDIFRKKICRKITTRERAQTSATPKCSARFANSKAKQKKCAKVSAN